MEFDRMEKKKKYFERVSYISVTLFYILIIIDYRPPPTIPPFYSTPIRRSITPVCTNLNGAEC